MSYSLEGGKITVTKGDSLWLDIRVFNDGEEYVAEENDELLFVVTDSDGNDVLTVDLPTDPTVLYLTPAQTEELQEEYEYQYTVTLNDSMIAHGFITCTKEVI